MRVWLFAIAFLEHLMNLGFFLFSARSLTRRSDAVTVGLS